MQPDNKGLGDLSDLPLLVKKVEALAGFTKDILAEIECATTEPLHPDVDNAMDLLQQAADMLWDAAGELAE